MALPQARAAAPERQSFRREPSLQPTLTMKGLRRQVQMVFQDPYESLNPRATVYETVAEALEVHGLAGARQQLLERVGRALEDAGLHPAEDCPWRRPHELSGGRRQRVVIPGALVLQPILLIADEPVSMLDVSIRAEILNLLDELRTRRGISVLCIPHDLGTAACSTDRIAVMYLGRIVEAGPDRGSRADPGRAGPRASPLHPGDPPGYPGPQPEAAAQAHDPHRRDAESGPSSQGMPIPPPLPHRQASLRRGRSELARGCAGTLGRLPRSGCARLIACPRRPIPGFPASRFCGRISSVGSPETPPHEGALDG